MVSKSEVINYAHTLVGNGVDYDGWFGMQCVDLIEQLDSKFWGDHELSGDAIDYMSNRMPKGQVRYRKGQTQIQEGDYAIWQFGPNDPYGHIGLVIRVDSNSVTCIEQNVDGAPVGVGGPARIKTRNLDFLVGFIRPPYSDNGKLKPVSKWVRIPEMGSFTSNIDENIYIRRGAPSTQASYAKDSSGKPVWYSKGETVNYDSYVINEGYVWISYIGDSGERNYIATGEWDETTGRRKNVWGTFV